MKINRDPNDDWAQVELHRWQYGALPKPDDYRPLNLSIAANAMADAIENGCKQQGPMPAPHNVCSDLRYLGNLAIQKH